MRKTASSALCGFVFCFFALKTIFEVDLHAKHLVMCLLLLWLLLLLLMLLMLLLLRIYHAQSETTRINQETEAAAHSARHFKQIRINKFIYRLYIFMIYASATRDMRDHNDDDEYEEECHNCNKEGATARQSGERGKGVC